MTTPTRPGIGRRLTGAAAALGLVASGAVGAMVLLVVLGALLPGLGALSGWATVLVPARGVTLVAAGLVATVIALALRLRLRRTGTGVAFGTGVSTAALTVVVGVVVVATVNAGGSVDPWRAIVPATGFAPPDDELVYATGPDDAALRAAVWAPRGASGSAPILVYVHGGGWNAGSELDGSADLRWFAERGRLVVSVGYTLTTVARPTWDIAGAQVACALTRVAGLAPARGGDPSRIVLAGDSAGGQLAVSVGYHAASGTQPSSCGGAVPVPRGVLTQYPAVDLVDAYEAGHFPGRPDTPGGYLAQLYTGGTPQQVPQRYRAVSGAAAITPRAPATLVIGPSRDELVPPGGVERFVDRARAAGVDATLVRIPFANHGYDLSGAGSLGDQARRTISEHWLTQHGW